MSAVDRLAELLRELPGIGPRQARRFVYYMRSRDQGYVRNIAAALADLHRDVSICERCYRMHNRASALCPICDNPARDASTLMVVSRDADLEALERSGAYKGLYFVLGGSIPLMERKARERVRIDELVARVEADRQSATPLREVVFALNANPEGEHTESVLREALKASLDAGIKASRLGRGLSTGSELEYADGETLKAALSHRDTV
jgi:recombination protein RecR